MKMEKWTAQCVHGLRNKQLRASASRLFQAIQSKIREPDANTLWVDCLERRIVLECRKLLDGFKMLDGFSFSYAMPDERKLICKLIEHLLDEAHAHVERNIEERDRLEYIMAEFTRITWPGLVNKK